MLLHTAAEGVSVQTLKNPADKQSQRSLFYSTCVDTSSCQSSHLDLFLPLQNLVNRFSSIINNQKPRIDQLDQDTNALSDDITALKEKVWSVPKE